MCRPPLETGSAADRSSSCRGESIVAEYGTRGDVVLAVRDGKTSVSSQLRVSDLGIFDDALSDIEVRAIVSFATEPDLASELDQVNALVEAFDALDPLFDAVLKEKCRPQIPG